MQLPTLLIGFAVCQVVSGFSFSNTLLLHRVPAGLCGQKRGSVGLRPNQNVVGTTKLGMVLSVPQEAFTTQQAALASLLLPSVLYLGQFLRRQRQSADGDPYELLNTVSVLKVDGGESTRITDMWGKDERAVVVFLRSFGCFFCQELAVTLKDQILPQLERDGIRLVVVGIGKLSIAEQFCAHTGFPASHLLADPDSASYEALRLNKGAITTFFRPETPLSLARRFLPGGGGGGDLVDALRRWKPWIPPKLDQAMQQGGVLVFDGAAAVMQHYDPATGVHADLGAVLRAAQDAAARAKAAAAGGEPCGCATE